MFDIASAVLDGAIAVIPTVSLSALFIRHCIKFQPSRPTRRPEGNGSPELVAKSNHTTAPHKPPVRPVKAEWMGTVLACALVAAIAVPAPVAALPPANAPLPVLTAKVVETKPAAIDFQGMTMRELREYCKANGIKGYSRYAKSKGALVRFLSTQ